MTDERINFLSLVIRRETESDHGEVENMVLESFWNVYHRAVAGIMSCAICETIPPSCRNWIS